MADRKRRPELDMLAQLTPEEFAERMMQISRYAHAEIIELYPDYVADRLEDEDEAAAHLQKWIELGGGALPVEESLAKLRRSSKRRPRDPAAERRKAADALKTVVHTILRDNQVRVQIMARSDIKEALLELAAVLEHAPIPTAKEAPKGAPVKEHVYCAAVSAVEFFPSEYKVATAARVFARAWKAHEESSGIEPPASLNVESIEKTMGRARRKAQREQEANIFDQWRAGKVGK